MAAKRPSGGGAGRSREGAKSGAARGPVMDGASPIDKLMERASRALEATRYFEAERLAATALGRALRAKDYERMGRIVLPLQEARRQKRQLAIDAAFPAAGGGPGVTLLANRRGSTKIEAGVVMFQPPLIGADARDFCDAANEGEVPVVVITREPLARDGMWPIVAVSGSRSVRTKVKPAVAVRRDEASATKDGFGVEDASAVSRVWVESSLEALGDCAIARVRAFEAAGDPPAWLVEDAVEFLEALGDHEKLHQELARVCRLALRAPEPTEPRRRGHAGESPFSF